MDNDEQRDYAEEAANARLLVEGDDDGDAEVAEPVVAEEADDDGDAWWM